MTTSPYHRFYAVKGRPVKIVPLPDGKAGALVFDFQTGGFVPDRSYVSLIPETGSGKHVDRLTEEEFNRLVAALRRTISGNLQGTQIQWERTEDGEIPYRAEVAERTLFIRINDFPAEPLYTLIIEGQAIEDLEDWPPAWVRPASPGAVLRG